MAEKYYSILTNRGKELEAQSSATGKPVIIKDFVVGDGNGQAVKPDPAQTKLVREVYRNAISALQVSPDQANQFFAQLVLPVAVGGFVVREVGLLTDTGELYSVANCAAIEKPENGVSVSLQYRLAVSETANIELKVATGDGLFLRIDKNLAEIAAKGEVAQKSSREAIGVLDATTARKGLVQLSSATNSSSEALAATPKAVKAAYDLANGKYTAQDATTAQKGIVQLSSATNSTSEALAATPKAVSAAVKELKDTLGSSAYKDVVSSRTDATAGRVLTTGWMSLGGYGTDNMLAAADAKKSLRNGFYGVQSEPTYGNASLISFGYDSGSQVHIIAKQGGQAPLLGVCGSTPQGDFGNWGKIYTEFQKPTALDVGAVPYRVALGTDDLNTVTGTKYGRFCQPLTANATAARHYPITEAGALDIHQTSANGAEACVQEYRSFSSRRIFLRTYNPDGSVWTDWCEFYTTAKKPTAADVGAIPLSGSTAVTGIVRSSAEFQSTSANNFRIAYGGYGTFWRQDGNNLYLMLTNNGDPYGSYNSLRPLAISLVNGYPTMSRLNLTDWTYFDARYQAKGNYTPAGQAYTKAESDGRYQPKGSYTPAGQAYTKAESNARYVQGWRLGAVASADNGNNDNAFADAPNGAVVVSVQQKTNYTSIKYRYAQYNINGTWYNAGVL